MKKQSLIFIAASAFGLMAMAQPYNPFENTQNLQVYPQDISAQDLHHNMIDFALALGTGCDYCHVPGEGGGYIFHSDDNPNKQIAREMMRMVMDINMTIDDLNIAEGPVPTQVTCMTCHRGQNRPVLIEDVFEAYRGDGNAEAAKDHYRRLHEIYYGSGTYTFSPFVVGEYAQKVMDQGDIAFGMSIAQLNIEFSPDDGYSYFVLGRAYYRQGQFNEALEAFDQAMERDVFPFIEGEIAAMRRNIANQQ